MTEAEELRLVGERLDLVTKAFLGLGADHGENIKSLVELCRSTVGCRAGSYWRREKGGLRLVAGWGEEAFPEDRAGLACVSRPVLSDGKDVGLIRLVLPVAGGLEEAELKFLGVVAGAIGVEEDRRAKRASLMESEEQLRQAQKMEAMGRLAGGMAHDFNNMLTGIMGYSELLLGQIEEGSEMRSDVEQIRATCARAAALTSRLLAMSRRQKIAPRVLDLNEVVADVRKVLGRVLGDDVEVRTALQPRLGPVRADPGQLEHALLNLAVNARDAMPEGGVLTLETSDVVLDDEYCRRHLNVRPGPYVKLSVTDTGIGMDEATREQMWDPFFTTKPKGKGTGLGLATVYGIARQAGGHIEAWSEPAKGARFDIFLPRAESSEEAPERPSAPAPAAGGGATVLVVDDDEIVRALVSRVLRLNGYVVVAADSPHLALELVEKRGTSPDLLLTDIVMPGLNGYELAKKLRALKPGLRTAFMSGYVGRDDAPGGFLEADVVFLQKPFTPGDLALQVGRALGAARRDA